MKRSFFLIGSVLEMALALAAAVCVLRFFTFVAKKAVEKTEVPGEKIEKVMSTETESDLETETEEVQTELLMSLENINKLKRQNAHVIVAVFHWGNELEPVPDSNQTTLAHLAIDEGADMVIGHHPHVLQGIESYKGKDIVYSLENFCFGGNTRPPEMDTMIYQQKFLLNSQKEIVDSERNIIPCSVSSEVTFNDYQPRVLTGQEAQPVLKKIQERSNAILGMQG